MLKYSYILALLMLSCMSIAQTKTLDEAKSYLERSKTEDGKKNFDQAELLAQKAIALYKKENAADQLGECYVSLWSIATNKGQSVPDRITLLKQADSAFKVSGNKRRQADCLIQMGDLSQSIGEYTTALPYLQQSLQLYKASGYKPLQAVLDLLSTVYYILGDYKSAIAYGLLAARTAEETGDSSLTTCTINNHIAMAYHGNNDFAKAKEYYERSLAIAQKHNDIGSIEVLAINYAYLLMSIGKSPEAMNDVDFFWRHSTNDGIYGPNTALLYTGKGSAAKHIGNQFSADLVVLPNAFIYLRAEFTWLKAGSYLKEVSAGKDILFAGVTTQLKL